MLFDQPSPHSLTPEQLRQKEYISQTFSEKSLAGLRYLPWYLDRLKEFPAPFLFQVIRHGVRDHYIAAEHMGGMGEFHSNAISFVQDGRLRSRIGMVCKNGLADMTVDNVRKILGKNTEKLKDDLLRYLQMIGHPSLQDSGSWADDMAIHFSSGTVADHLYGGEGSNEVFIAVPSLFVVSQFPHRGMISTGNVSIDNDVWLWDKLKGVDANVGILFLPGNATVHSDTGSQQYGEGELIRSKDFWERQLNASKKISKVVYYDISLAPQETFLSWLQTERLMQFTKDPHPAVEYWFPENFAMGNQSVELFGFEEFSAQVIRMLD